MTKAWVLSRLLWAAVPLAGMGCGGSDPPGRTCLSDAQICQFHEGVSTTDDVRAALGPPQVSQSVSSGGTSIQQWVYICMATQTNSDLVQFLFDGNGVLEGFAASRSGPNAMPAPTCN